MAKRPPRPTQKASVSLRIEGLSCIETVDEMLMEGARASDTAAFIQEDQGLLQDVPTKTLINALLVRRRAKRETAEAFEAEHWSDTGVQHHEEEVVWRRKPKLPSVLAKDAYERTKGGIKEINELEALYLTQRDRIERMIDMEFRAGIFAEKMGGEIAIAGNLLMQRLKAREAMGLVGRTTEGDLHLHLDVGVYSQNTVAVLQDPEKRHRILSILERMSRLKELPSEAEVIDSDESE